ncbi:hypothetical protein MRX96_007350 [Rhipicephalus microplus]
MAANIQAAKNFDKMADEDLEGLRQKRLDAMKNEDVVVHFFRESTFRCKIVDKHLAILAQKHVETRFCKISVDRAPFLCDRMKIRGTKERRPMLNFERKTIRGTTGDDSDDDY